MFAEELKTEGGKLTSSYMDPDQLREGKWELG